MSFSEKVTRRILDNNESAPGGVWPEGYTIAGSAFAAAALEYFADRINGAQLANSFQCDLTPGTDSRVQLDAWKTAFNASNDKVKFALHFSSILTNAEVDIHNTRQGGASMGYRTEQAIEDHIASLSP